MGKQKVKLLWASSIGFYLVLKDLLKRVVCAINYHVIFFPSSYDLPQQLLWMLFAYFIQFDKWRTSFIDKRNLLLIFCFLFSLFLSSAMGGLGRIDDVDSAQLLLPCTKVIFCTCYFTDKNLFIFSE